MSVILEEENSELIIKTHHIKKEKVWNSAIPVTGDSLHSVAETLKEIFNSQQYADVQIVGQNGSLWTHGIVLAAISPFLRLVLDEADLGNKDSIVLSMPDVPIDILKSFLHNLYSGSLEEVVVDSHLEFLSITTDCVKEGDVFKIPILPNKIKVEQKDVMMTSFDQDYELLNAEEAAFYGSGFSDDEDQDPMGDNDYFIEKESDPVDSTSDSDDDYVPSGSAKKAKKKAKHPRGVTVHVVSKNLPIKGTRKKSPVWNYFTPITRNSARCNSCSKEIATEMGTTTGMRNHMRIYHSEGYAEMMLTKAMSDEASAAISELENKAQASNKEHFVWDCFTSEEDDARASCNECDEVFPLEGKFIPTLIRHFQTHHEERFHELLRIRTGQKSTHKRGLKKSPVWSYFTKTERDRATCNSCSTSIKSDGGSTTGMINHLKHHHPELYMEMMDRKVSGEIPNIKSEFAEKKNFLVWNYFTSNVENQATCNTCEENFPLEEEDSQDNLVNHLEELHKEKYDEMKQEEDKVLKEEHDNSLSNLKAGKRSLAWNYFTPIDLDHASCNDCASSIKTEGTTGMFNHLKLKHPDLYGAVQQEKLELINMRNMKRSTDPNLSVHRPGVKKSLVWNHFGVLDRDHAACNECGTHIKTEGGTTTGMRNHLKYQHPDIYVEMVGEQNSDCKPDVAEANSIKRVKFTKQELVASGLLPGKKKSAIWDHFEPTEDKDSNVCKICQHIITGRGQNTTNMIRHLKTHHVEAFRSFVDENCRRQEKRIALGPKTEKSGGGKVKRGRKPMYDESPEHRTCPECKKPFSCRQAMLFHRRCVHSGIKPYKCKECGLEFARADSYRSHACSQSDFFQSHLCQVCGKTFGRKYLRDNHERAHFNDRRVPCSFCEKKFMTNQQKMHHERTHTGEKPYQCQDCGRQFAQRHQLKTHMRIHTGEKPYNCKFCNQNFRHISSRNNHKCERKPDGYRYPPLPPMYGLFNLPSTS